MPRIARVVAVGLPHHITQRGNYQQKVFLDAQDRRKYLTWVRDYSWKYGLSVLAYCLMPNHVHFIVIPNAADSLGKVFNTAHMRYSQYFNKKLNQKGHLWQGRFFSCVLDGSHFILAARYIERNPVRAGLAEKPWKWPSSSAITHVNEGKDIDLPEEENLLQGIRKHTFSGRPLGSQEFVETLENRLGRRLEVPPIGRPKKQ